MSPAPPRDGTWKHRPCKRCGFWVHTAAARCADCGHRQGWRRPQERTPALQHAEALLASRVQALASQRQRLDAARATAVQRMSGADARRAEGLSAIIHRIDDGMSQVSALVARCNQLRRETSQRRQTLSAAAIRAEHALRLAQGRAPGMRLAQAQLDLRWSDRSSWLGAVISPGGRWVALVGGDAVLLIDLTARRIVRIPAAGASGLTFSADARLLRFPDGRTWGCTTRNWLDLPAAWIPPPQPQPLHLLSALPHDLSVPAPDPRWRLHSDGGRLVLRASKTDWVHPLLRLPSQRGLVLQSGVLIVAEPATPRISLYWLTADPSMRWDAWRLRDDPILHDQARAVLLDGMAEECRSLEGTAAVLKVRMAMLLQACHLLSAPGLVDGVSAAIEGALGAALMAALDGDAPPAERADTVSRLGALAAWVAVQLDAPEDSRLRALAEQAPRWGDALLVESASGSLISLTGGGALQALLSKTPGPALTLPPAASRVEPPDPEAALAELAGIQRDIDAQLDALSEILPH